MEFSWNKKKELGISDKYILENESRYTLGVVQTAQCNVLLELVKLFEDRIKQIEEKVEKEHENPSKITKKK